MIQASVGDITVGGDELLASFDVSPLFTNVQQCRSSKPKTERMIAWLRAQDKVVVYLVVNSMTH